MPETWLLAASGPSQRKEDLDFARGKARVLVINNTWELAPWADVLYACDQAWWEAKQPDFPGIRIIGKGDHPRCLPVPVQVVSHMIFDGPHIGAGGNSGFQALNLVIRWGARRVILTGYDYRGAGDHWHGRHPAGLRQATESTVARWRLCMDQAAPILAERGVEVINASRETALTCFPRVNLKDVL